MNDIDGCRYSSTHVVSEPVLQRETHSVAGERGFWCRNLYNAERDVQRCWRKWILFRKLDGHFLARQCNHKATYMISCFSAATCCGMSTCQIEKFPSAWHFVPGFVLLNGIRIHMKLRFAQVTEAQQIIADG